MQAQALEVLKIYQGLIQQLFIVSFFLGAAIKGLFFKEKKQVFTFNTPIGFFVLLAILQVVYYIFTLKSLNGVNVDVSVYMQYTKYICYGALAFSLVCIVPVWRSIKNYWQWGTIPRVLLACVITYWYYKTFQYTAINYRLDDINFYEPFISSRLSGANENLYIYIYQGYYTLLSVLNEFANIEFAKAAMTPAASIVFAAWMPSLLCIPLLTFTAIDLETFIEKRTKKPLLAWILFVSAFIFCCVDYWNIHNPNTGNTLRRAVVMLVIVVLSEMIRSKKPSYAILASLLIGANISLSSSSFFVSMILLYVFVIFSMITKRKTYFLELFLMLPYPLMFAMQIKPEYSKLFLLGMGVYGLILLVLKLLKKDGIDAKLSIVGWVVLALVPIVMVVAQHLGYPSDELKLIMLQGRKFTSPINHFDQVPDLIKMPQPFTNIFVPFKEVFPIQIHEDAQQYRQSLLACMYWITLVASCGVVFVKRIKKVSFEVMVGAITVITFYNPFVYDFVGSYLTSVGFFRITDLLISIPTVGMMLYALCYISKKAWAQSIVLVAISFFALIKAEMFYIPYLVPEENREDFNILYHTNQKDLDLVHSFESFIMEHDEDYESHDGPYRVVSHIYGTQYFTDTLELKNKLEDRFAYTVVETDEFERLFCRKYPEIVIPGSKEYYHGCSLAFDSDIEYIFLDSQYNLELQKGLWTCSNILGTDDTFTAIYVDPEYWDWELTHSETMKYKVENHNVVGIDEDYYIENKIEKPDEAAFIESCKTE